MSEKLECVRCGHETYKHPSMLECRGCTDCAPPRECLHRVWTTSDPPRCSECGYAPPREEKCGFIGNDRMCCRNKNHDGDHSCLSDTPPPSADAAEENIEQIELYLRETNATPQIVWNITALIRAALAAERERCARIAKNAPDVCDCADRIAAAIRSRKGE